MIAPQTYLVLPGGTAELSSPAPVGPTYVPPELFEEIHRLKEQADWMGRLIEDDEQAFTYGTDGTIQFGMSQQGPTDRMFSYSWAFSQCMFRPSYGAAFFVNEAQHRIIRARSRAFCSQNPYWHGVQHNVRTHVVGLGHKWTAVSRDPVDKVDKKKLAKVQKELDEFYEGTGDYAGQGSYRDYQLEKCDRKSRDGEYFLEMLDEDGHLRVRFIEPLCIWTPPNKTENDDVWFGIQFKRPDFERPRGYYVLQMGYLGSGPDPSTASQSRAKVDTDAWSRMRNPDTIQHRKVNVDKGCLRGVPDTYWVQSRLEQSLRTLKAMGTLVQVRAKIAFIRTRINALAGSVQPMLSARAAATITGPGSVVTNVMHLPDGSIVDMSDQSQWTSPAQNIETDKIVASVQADLQAVATSVGLADYMVSGNLGNSSYASSMVASGPVVKTFQQAQQAMVEEDREIVTRLLQIAIEAKRLDEDTLDVIRVEMNGPPLAARADVIQEAQAKHIMLEDGVLSVTTWQQQEGLDPEAEAANNADAHELMLKRAKEMAAIQPPMATGGGARPGGGQPGAAGVKARATARPFSASQEPRQQQRASGATREEEIVNTVHEYLVRAFTGDPVRFQESSYEPHAQDMPTAAELEMAAVFITPEWLENTKSQIMALANGSGSPREWGPREEYEPGVAGVRLGTVDAQDVWAVDASAVMIAHDAPDFVCAGNHMRWPWIPADKILIDWSYSTIDAWHDLLHEAIETRLMDAGKWGYAIAHKIANSHERDWLLALRPELADLKPKE